MTPDIYKAIDHAREKKHRVEALVARYQKMPMLALSLWQPWASFVAWGFKKIETRSWSTPYRGLLAIHAAKTEREMYQYRLLLSGAGVIDGLDAPDPAEIPANEKAWPFGKIVAVANLVTSCWAQHWGATPTARETALGQREYRLGKYEATEEDERRFGWVLEDVVPVKPEIGLRGRQKLFSLHREISLVLAEIWRDGALGRVA